MLKKLYIKLIKKIQKSNQPNKLMSHNFQKKNHESKFQKDSIKNADLKIISSYDKNFEDVGNITSKTIENYARKFNFKFEFPNMPETGRPKSWNKIQLIRNELLKKESDFIMWVDADAFFLVDAINIINSLDSLNEIFLVNHYCSVHKGTNYANTILTINRINCGVMIFKVSDFNINFLENIWNKENYINHPWWEQAAIMDIIGLKAEITSNLKDHKGNDNYLNKIKFLPKEWNSIPSYTEISTESINPSIIHLAGINNNKRIDFLNEYINKGKIKI